MKKIFIVMALIFMLSGIAMAQDSNADANTDSLFDDMLKILKLEDTIQGIGYSQLTHSPNYMFTKPIFKKDKGFWKYVNAGIGYNSEDKIVATGYLHVLALKDLGVTTPVLDLVDIWVGAYGGWGRVQLGGGMSGNNKWDAGYTVTLIRLKR